MSESTDRSVVVGPDGSASCLRASARAGAPAATVDVLVVHTAG